MNAWVSNPGSNFNFLTRWFYLLLICKGHCSDGISKSERRCRPTSYRGYDSNGTILLYHILRPLNIHLSCFLHVFLVVLTISLPWFNTLKPFKGQSINGAKGKPKSQKKIMLTKKGILVNILGEIVTVDVARISMIFIIAGTLTWVSVPMLIGCWVSGW